MAKDPTILAHQQWLGYLQPVGLVVSPPALVQCQAFVNANVAAEHARLLSHFKTVPVGLPEPASAVTDLKALLTDPGLFGWRDTDLVPANDPRAAGLEVVLPEYHETLKPTYAVPAPEGGGWLMLIREWPLGTDLDRVTADDRQWQASPQTRFERLLRETGVPIGLLSNGTDLRLVYYPRGESPGHITFPVAAMAETAGRPVVAALLMLLGADRLFTLPDRQRLPALLAESRKYQNSVSNELAEQVLAALFELVRGFQAADDQRNGELLRDVLARDPDQVYAGLVTVLMRLVFLLYAEDRGLMPGAGTYVRYYSVAGLFERLREDAGRHPDTMDHRYGAWAQLLALFRLVHDGGGHRAFRLPARHGYLFEPDRYPFLEGRPAGHRRQSGERINPPLVSDGVLFRVLTNLLVLDGERLSYRNLDVEQIGSVYEAIMGYRMERAAGRSIALKPKKAHGAPVTINLDELLGQKPADRSKWLKEHTDQSVEGKALAALKEAETPADAVTALEKKVAKALTPNIVPQGAMIVQPSEERRRSGSHYTPRSLTAPIVRKALEPVLKQLGPNPTPEQILNLKVCDPAMGSGAFLVEFCRQLAEALLKAWVAHRRMPKIPGDETPELYAQRVVAQRCLYGVDKNPMAVALAKLSLWLATLAKDHPFTFLDHALKCGDSLVGLCRDQIRRFHWKPGHKQMVTGFEEVLKRIDAATKTRQDILDAGDEGTFAFKEQKLAAADEALGLVRLAGDLVLAAYFAADKDKKRQEKRDDYLARLAEYLRTGNTALRPTADVSRLREGRPPIDPFHWEIEFPEVFRRSNPGFDCIAGNPPFLGGTLIGGQLGTKYHEYLIETYTPATGLADLIAFFLRSSFSLLRNDGAFGLIATNTVAQGDTRATGLEAIVGQGGRIYHAQRRYSWPGLAAVVVSLIHVAKARNAYSSTLDGRAVDRISAFLHRGHVDSMPVALKENKGTCFLGTKIWGAGFVFEDEPSDGSSSISEMERLISEDPRNQEVILRYMGGEEFNTSPTQSPRRYVIDFGNMTEAEARKWPALFSLVEERVRPVRATNKQRNYRENWWLHANRVDEAGPYMRQHGRVLALTSVSRHLSVAFARSGTVLANSMVLILLHEYADFAVIQSRVHEVWARFAGSSMKDDLRYSTPCFDTFPRPQHEHKALNAVGMNYHNMRARIMVASQSGLTATYNRFHDPSDSSAEIRQLRELHEEMDRAVFDAYGGDLARLDIPPCEFLLDYDDEDEDESTTGRQKRKPWRYRWPDAFREEVLELLLNLNRKRAEEEQLAASNAEPKKSV